MTRDTTKSIAEKLVSYCQANNDEACLNELYANDAVSIESIAMPGTDSAETKGLDGIKGKHEWWNNAFEVHSHSAEGPFLHGEDRFGVIFAFDATNKETGERESMKELGLYKVKNGKITREEFYYSMP